MILNQWLNTALCVRYFTELISGSFDNVPMNKTRHYVFDIYRVYLGIIL